MVAAIRSDTLVLMLCALLLLNYPAETEANVRLCGVKLTRTLMGICRGQVCGGFMGPSMMDKRSEPSSPQNIANQNVAHFMSLAKRSGIATECCHRRCSFNYLKTYCC